MNPLNNKPHPALHGATGACEHREYLKSLKLLYGMPNDARIINIPDSWRERMPDPANYYAAHLEGLRKPNASGWARCGCPFHEDRNASASANLHRGAFRCHGCGVKGDMIAFHQRITGRNFKEAVRDLLGVVR